MYRSLLHLTLASTVAFSLLHPMSVTNAATSLNAFANKSGTVLKTSEQFKDLKDLDAGMKKIVDFMLAQGHVEGMSDTHFGLKGQLTRAQVAKIATKLFGIHVDRSVQQSSFTDVSAQIPEQAWGIPYIEAAKRASLIEGVDPERFDPDGSITLGQTAAILVRGLGLTAEAEPNEPWYTRYMRSAQAHGIDFGGKTGDTAATREDFIVAAYQAHQALQLVSNEKVSVVSAEAIDYNKVKVQFNRSVDREAAKLALTKAGKAVAATVAFAEDQPSAVLTLTEDKLTEGRYKVTLGGLEQESVEQSEAEFTAENEVVTRIDFVSESEMLAKSRYASIRFKAINQYGEKASFQPGLFSYTVNDMQTLSPKLDKTPDGDLRLTLDTLTYNVKNGPANVYVSLWLKDTNITAQKTFTVGTEPLVTQLKTGTISYSDGQTAIRKKDQKAEIELIPYDQYGHVLGFNALREALKADEGTANLKNAVRMQFNPGEIQFGYDIVDERGDDTVQANITLTDDSHLAADSESTASIYMQGAMTSVILKLQAYAKAVTIEFGDLNTVIANGDKDVYIPVIAYDASGAKLSADDLASDAFAQRTRIVVSGAEVEQRDSVWGKGAVIQNNGKNKGTIHLTSITAPANGKLRLSAYIVDEGKGTEFTREYTVQNARVPARIKPVKVPASEIVPGSYTPFTYVVVDQYEEQIDTVQNVLNGKVVESGGDVYSIKLDPSWTMTNTVTDITYGVTLDKAPAKGGANRPSFDYAASDFEAFNDDGFRFYAPYEQADGSYTFSAQLLKNGKEISRAVREVQVRKTDDLSYSLKAIPDLFRAIGSGIVPTAYRADHLDPAKSKFAQKLAIKVTNTKGEEIYFVDGISQAIASSDPQIVETAVKSGSTYVLGNKAGEAKVSVVYKNTKNEQKIATANVRVKADPLAVSSITADNETATLTMPSSGSVTEYVYTLMDFSFKSNYGISYADGNTVLYNYAFGNVFGVRNIVPIQANMPLGTVRLDEEGRVIVTGNVGRFDLVAYKGTEEVRTRVTVVRAP